MDALMGETYRSARLVLALRKAGVRDPAVLSAMEAVDRSAFVDDSSLAGLAFEDTVLPIPCGQSMLRPSAAGRLLEALDLGAAQALRVLLIGAGSGHMAALIAETGAQVFAVERYMALADALAARCDRLGLTRIETRHGDGLEGWAGAAPFDRIVLSGTVAAPPRALLDQLAAGGVLAAPAGQGADAEILVLTADGAAQRRPCPGGAPPLVPGVAAAL